MSSESWEREEWRDRVISCSESTRPFTPIVLCWLDPRAGYFTAHAPPDAGWACVAGASGLCRAACAALCGVRHRALLQRLPAEELGCPISKGQKRYFSFPGKPVLRASTVLSDLQAMLHRTGKIAMLPMNTRKVVIWISNFTSSHGISWVINQGGEKQPTFRDHNFSLILQNYQV